MNNTDRQASAGPLHRIQTAEFRLRPGVHARQALMRRALRFWMAGALPLAILVALAWIYDVRLLFVAAALLLIIFPTLLMIAWYSLLSRPWAVASLALQSVTFEPDGDIVVEYRPDTASDIPVRQPADLYIPAAAVERATISGDYIIVSYGDRRDLIVPLASFTSPSDVAGLLSRYGF